MTSDTARPGHIALAQLLFVRAQQFAPEYHAAWFSEEGGKNFPEGPPEPSTEEIAAAMLHFAQVRAAETHGPLPLTDIRAAIVEFFLKMRDAGKFEARDAAIEDALLEKLKKLDEAHAMHCVMPSE